MMRLPGFAWRWLARFVGFLFWLFDDDKPIDVAFISNCRDQVDLNRIGNPSDFISWTRYVWEGVRGRLYMISSTTEEIRERPEAACRKFRLAVAAAVADGARVILYAAGTKRLPIWDELKEKYPQVIFTLGDNFTGVLLQAGIDQAIRQSGLHLRAKANNDSVRVLLLAPYGLLGTASFHGLVKKPYVELVLMGSPERRHLIEQMASAHNIDCVDSFDAVGKVDVVVACNHAPWSQLTEERIEMLRRLGRRLLVIDPCEPANLKRRVVEKCGDRVIRLESGDGFSENLSYVLGSIAWKINRMDRGTTWGCFCEAMIIAKHLHEHPEWRQADFYEVTPEMMATMHQFFGDGQGQFRLPANRSFEGEVRDLRLAYAE